MNPIQLPTEDPILQHDGENDSGEDSDVKPARRSGRRKIKIEYIEDKNRRHITFSKRKAGIMKKAYELSTLTGTQVLLLVVSETGLVYTFTTVKLQPIVTKPEGKNLIQSCLNASDITQSEDNDEVPYNPGQSRVDIEKKPMVKYDEKKAEAVPAATTNTAPPPSASPSSAYNPSSSPYQQQSYGNPPPSQAYGHPAYMNTPYVGPNQGGPPSQQQQQQQHQSPQQQQQPYGQMPGNGYYGNQQQHYMQQQQPQQQQQQQQPGYWPSNPTSPAMRDDKARRGGAPTEK